MGWAEIDSVGGQALVIKDVKFQSSSNKVTMLHCKHLARYTFD
jgi:hypothetical protein